MGQLDRTNQLRALPGQRMGLTQDRWLHLLNTAHDHMLMPYEMAEIEEYTLAYEEPIGSISSATTPPSSKQRATKSG
jgi:hypothetical protein